MALTAGEEQYYRRSIGGDFSECVPSSPRGQVADYYAILTTQNTVTLTQTPNAIQPVFILKNGILLIKTTDYSVFGTTVTFVTNLSNGDKVRCFYQK